MPFWFRDHDRTVWDDRIVSILRIMTGLMFMQHGAQKILGWFGGMGGNTAPMMSQFWFAGMLELVGGLLIAIGLFTRITAFILAGEMAVAYFHAHVRRGGIIPIVNQGELAALYCFVFLYFAVRGAGVWSVDAMMGRDRYVDTTTPAPPPLDTAPRRMG